MKALSEILVREHGGEVPRDLEALDIGTTDEWIVERVGIRSRRTVLPLDYIRRTRNRDPRASVVDLGMTQVVDGDLLKVMAWYDNEWGYSNQMVREALRVLGG